MISKEEIAAKIPDLAERENAAVLLRALVDAEIAVGEAPDDQLEAARAKLDAADATYSDLGFPAFSRTRTKMRSGALSLASLCTKTTNTWKTLRLMKWCSGVLPGSRRARWRRWRTRRDHLGFPCRSKN